MEMTTVKERPILFSSEMVRAILDGNKTQTRRVVKMPKWIERLNGDFDRAFPDKAFGVTPCLQIPCVHPDGDTSVQRLRNPWGWPEPSRLWVRETWQPIRDRSPELQEKIKAWFDKNDTSNFMNEVDEWAPLPEGQVRAVYAADFGDWAFDVDSDLKPWKPSIFMPRWASRITLEITNVRVERLNDISEEDAKAEGASIGETHILASVFQTTSGRNAYRRGFKELWEKINGKKHPWSSSPFIWVIEFKQI
jgi:hypothetical protein